MNFGSGEFTMSKTYKDQKAKKVGYKNPPKANQWKAGQSGNPSGKKKTTNKPSEAFNKILAKLLQEHTEITIAGKKQKVSLAELWLRKLLHNGINAPLGQQVLALKQLVSLGLIDPQGDMFDQVEADFDPFTEEHKRLLKITQEALKDCDLDA